MSHLHLKSYKSHESVRERNKREQRKFDLTSDGRYNEFKFKLNGISKEQKLVEKDLERIRAGAHRPPKSAINSSQQSFNSPNVRSLTEKNLRKKHQEKISPKRSPRPRRKSEEVEIDTEMLVNYLQKLQEAKVIDIDNVMVDQEDKAVQPVNQALTPEPQMSQNSAHHVERSGSLNNNQLNLPIIDDKHIQSRRASDSKLDLIHKSKTPSPDQRHLKTLPVAVIMSAPTSGVSIEKELSNSPKQTYGESDIQSSGGSSKGSGDVLSRKKSSSQEDFNNMKQVYSYENIGDFRNNKPNNSSDKQWEQARCARYVRNREPLERDRELTVKEIFDQTTKR